MYVQRKLDPQSDGLFFSFNQSGLFFSEHKFSSYICSYAFRFDDPDKKEKKEYKLQYMLQKGDASREQK